MTPETPDELHRAMDLITRIAAGATSFPAEPTETGTNEKDTALVVGLNMLAEELEARRKQRAEEDEQRLDEQLERERTLATQLVQAQKLQAVGQSSAALVHDFNNVLGIILNSVAFLRSEERISPGFERELGVIEQAALRGADLSRQLMSVSRQDLPTNVEPLELGELIRTSTPLLRRLLRSSISLEVEISERPLLVRVRQSQLMQVVVNLMANARDAVSDGGHIVIRVDESTALPDASSGLSVSSRAYALMTVTDDGEGMTPLVLERAFEPFFTSKPEGRGTGLGLSICRDIVGQAGGHVSLHSEPGRGTSVLVFLPLCPTG